MSMHSLPNLSHYGACWEIMRFCPHLGLMLAVLYHTTGPSAAAWGVESEQNHHHKKKKKKRKANSCVYAKWRNYDWFFLFGFYFFFCLCLSGMMCVALGSENNRRCLRGRSKVTAVGDEYCWRGLVDSGGCGATFSHICFRRDILEAANCYSDAPRSECVWVVSTDAQIAVESWLRNSEQGRRRSVDQLETSGFAFDYLSCGVSSLFF